MSAPVTYVVTLQTERGRDGVRDLRFLLKIAKRHLHLRALDVREQTIHRRDARRGLPTPRSVGEGKFQMVNLRKYGPTNKWLKLEDLHDKPPMRERIGLVKPDNGKFGERLVLTFEPSGQMLSLNKTSVGNLLRDFGEDDSNWVGQLVEVYAGEVETQNGPTDAVLVRGVTDVPADAAIAAKAAKATKAAKKSNDFDDTVPF
jgi:hypothetical protein